MDITSFAVIGGDERYAILASLLAREGFTVFGAGFDRKPELADGVVQTDPVTAGLMAQTVILPLPPTNNGEVLFAPLSFEDIPLDERFCIALGHRRIFCGMPERLRAVSENYTALDLWDYGRDEAFLLLNAQLTAEAALMLAIRNMPESIFGSRCLVTGYGRIGRAMSRLLKELGADVTITARRSADFAHAKSNGLKTLSYVELPKYASTFRLAVNCADALVLNENVIERMEQDAVILDLASKPGGTHWDAAKRRGINAIHALGLPGKYSPLSAAHIIMDTILAKLEEENNDA